jgi:hypothetical protein
MMHLPPRIRCHLATRRTLVYRVPHNERVQVAVFPPKGIQFPRGSDWHKLLAGLVAAGAEQAEWAGDLTHPTAIVALNHHEAVDACMRATRLPPRDCVLVVLEPEVTAPRMYTPGVRSRYGHVFAASTRWARRLRGEAFCWPQELTWNDVGAPEGTVASVLVNAHKRSAVRGSLYGLRREIIRTFQVRRLQLSLFGRGWSAGLSSDALEGSKAVGRALLGHRMPHLGEAYGDSGWKPVQWRGPVEHKADAFQMGNVGIVVENSADYVSEKLFDVVRHGLAAVYVGPPLEEFGIPEGIAVATSPDPAHVADAVSALTPAMIQDRVELAREWLMSDGAAQHDQAAVLHDLGMRIGRALLART